MEKWTRDAQHGSNLINIKTEILLHQITINQSGKPLAIIHRKELKAQILNKNLICRKSRENQSGRIPIKNFKKKEILR
jgi:hypothetical protein